MENLYYEYKRDAAVNMYIFQGISTHAQRHFHRAIEMLYVTEGEIETTVGDEKFIASADEIIFVHNYYVHSFAPKGQYKKFVFIIPASYEKDVNKILKGLTLPPLLADKEFNKREILPLVTKLYEGNDTLPRLAKKGYINIIFGLLLDHYPTSAVKKADNIDFMVEILHYIDEHFREPITLESIAGAFGYNKCYFSRVFNRYIGESLSNYVNVVRLREFMEKARDEDSPQIAKLAVECGFVSMPTFYRAFTKLYGCSPKAYFGDK